MKKAVLFLPEYGIPTDIRSTFYYISGPQGDWMLAALNYLSSKDPKCWIAVSADYDCDDPRLEDYLIVQNRKKYPYKNHLEWEKHCEKVAANNKSTALAFWFPSVCDVGTAKKELEHWSKLSAVAKNYMKYDPRHVKPQRINLVIGVEQQFNHLKLIRKIVDEHHGLDEDTHEGIFPIMATLCETLSRAINLACSTTTLLAERKPRYHWDKLEEVVKCVKHINKMKMIQRKRDLPRQIELYQFKLLNYLIPNPKT